MIGSTLKKASLRLDAELIDRIFQIQKAKAPQLVSTTAKQRVKKIKKIKNYIDNNLDRIQDALHRDLRKAPAEVVLTETLMIQNEIKQTARLLRRWMKPQKVEGDIFMLGTKAYVQPEPKGVCLIISPWNYPFNLAIKPLISCIAAGNTAILKPSEHTPHTSSLLKEMIVELFVEDEVTVIEGAVDVAQELLSKPFDHIFFTGSPKVGKIVMAAAARHLSSITLELGGKSPTIIDETANLKDAAERIAWGKLINNGQTCIAPDYILVQHTVQQAFVEALKKAIIKMYDPDGNGIKNSPDYCRIINKTHFGRIKRLLDDAIQQGATVDFGGDTDEADNFISPTLLSGLKSDMDIMQEEIFGPILPIVGIEDLDEAVAFIRAKPKPLALYLYSKKRSNIDYLLKNTTSGNMVINDGVIHYAHPHLPFGGVNNSGIGKSGGHFGFVEFSNQKGVLEQKFGTLKPLFPPYNNTVDKLLNIVSRII